ncbi:hypothetical protein [Paracoccus shanxieyensis]|uniref:Uncharacterized protein n=1 Tax=Paracoccus shanxieyensis TaxID=2675752 RepID=A0A6L6J7G4_9RHOB|nr:hypothetical protein [Paracoccus shanxieyensis]MTH66747.1 hypothetical protein [Paracoccus shanxieyensis]MTH89982.1 hypothetical protein [Paracoccus shanxieyensis]
MFVSEMKCEIEFQNFKFFTLDGIAHLDHHTKPAFFELLKCTKPEPEDYCVVKGNKLRYDGAVLIWGTVDPDARQTVMLEKGFHDILGIDDICRDLAEWSCPKYQAFLDQRRAWCDQLFNGLSG